MEVDSATWQNIAEGAEQALYARFCELDVRYKNQYRVILAGLKDRANGYLLRKIAQGDVKASQLATMSREELEPPLWVGHIHQQGLTKFLARAHRVSGNCARLPEVGMVQERVVGCYQGCVEGFWACSENYRVCSESYWVCVEVYWGCTVWWVGAVLVCAVPLHWLASD